MFYITNKVGDKYGVIDTYDGVVEYYNLEEIKNFTVNCGIGIGGVFNNCIKVIQPPSKDAMFCLLTILITLDYNDDSLDKYISFDGDNYFVRCRLKLDNIGLNYSDIEICYFCNNEYKIIVTESDRYEFTCKSFNKCANALDNLVKCTHGRVPKWLKKII